MENNITIIKIGFAASFWCDIKTYGTLIGMYAVNERLLNGNNWVDFILMVMFILMIVSRVAGAKYISKFKTNEEAIKFLKEQAHD